MRSVIYGVLITVFLAGAGTVQAVEGLVLTVDRVQKDPYAKIIVSVKNKSQRTYNMVVVSCAWLKDGKAQATSPAMIGNLTAQQTGYGVMTTISKFDYDNVSCRIEGAY